MNSSISILLSTLKAILPFSYMAGPSVPFRQISTPGNQVKLRHFSQCLYFCSTLFCLLVIITLLLRRCTSWRQCHRSLSQSFHHSFPEWILTVPVLYELSVCTVSTSPWDRSAVLHVHPRWTRFLLQVEGLAVNQHQHHIPLFCSFSISSRYLPVAFMSYSMCQKKQWKK